MTFKKTLWLSLLVMSTPSILFSAHAGRSDDGSEDSDAPRTRGHSAGPSRRGPEKTRRAKRSERRQLNAAIAEAAEEFFDGRTLSDASSSEPAYAGDLDDDDSEEGSYTLLPEGKHLDAAAEEAKRAAIRALRRTASSSSLSEGSAGSEDGQSSSNRSRPRTIDETSSVESEKTASTPDFGPTEAFQKYGALPYDTSRNQSYLAAQKFLDPETQVFDPVRFQEFIDMWTAADFACHAIHLGDLPNLQLILAGEGVDVLTQCPRYVANDCPAFALPLHRHILEYIGQNAPQILEVAGENGRTPAFNAPDLWALQQIVHYAPSKADILNAVDLGGQTLAHRFVGADSFSQFQYVVETASQGAQLLDMRDFKDRTPAMLAVEMGVLEALRYSVQHARSGHLSLENTWFWRTTQLPAMDILTYLATLPNRATLLSPFDIPLTNALIAFGNAQEDVDRIRREVSELPTQVDDAQADASHTDAENVTNISALLVALDHARARLKETQTTLDEIVAQETGRS